MTMEGLISFVELFCQGKANDVVVSHHSNPFVLFLVLSQHIQNLLSSPSQVGWCLIDESFLHVVKDGIQHL
jgi:hypothetical protein